MPENEPTPDRLAQLRTEYEDALKALDPEGPRTAVEILHKHQGAIPLFELGLKLAREMPEGTEELIEEIRERLRSREQELGEQLYPARRR
ncbi:MAG: hypothetical protein UT36_C0002G0003 [Candidatus Peregrinibacteria bacterium GW2011_GWF2_39_17]|nr:MAG: hypothetical protein UT36_C0002G0003 [Candidatus Peregrinibacteria bacterium GW2011_GWF2_39_17]HCW32107.1 hypothetical protein [Candidatus Peregrinibacteria bacterium]